ncbi:MAG: deoxyguanosinetriphosphate triphosphohydrolase, partial [Sulfurimicrobium sp.]
MTELAPYAAHPQHTRGRRHPEPAPPGRSEFERDRDRIIHSTA